VYTEHVARTYLLRIRSTTDSFKILRYVLLLCILSRVGGVRVAKITGSSSNYWIY
jgi:hypothetical protein